MGFKSRKKCVEIAPANCAVLEKTADGQAVGRCWIHLLAGKYCSRHGDVSAIQQLYVETGQLQKDPRLTSGEGELLIQN